MADFRAVADKFRMNLAHNDGHSERVVVQIGLDGLKLLSASDNRVMRSYDLSHISRWQSRGGSLILYTRTPVDVEERQTTLTGDDTTVRNALDTLTCCCMQLAELLQSKQTETAQETANNLHALVVGGGKKKTPLPSADEVEYWRSPDKAGWLQSQGDHLKTWRNRWFVLKQGFLFRFYNDKVSESVKPRGVVDLSKVQDVRVVAGRGNTIQLKTASGGAVAYVAASETETVEWVSAIEGAMQKIMRHAAGVDDEAPAAAAAAAAAASKGKGSASSASKQHASSAAAAASAPRPSPAANPAEWLRQLERGFESSAGGGGGGGGGHHGASSSGRGGGGGANLGSTLVSVVGYESAGGGGGGGGGGAYRDPYRAPETHSPYSALNRQYSGGYAPIQGSSIAGAQSLGSDLDLNYGGGGAAAPQPHLAGPYGQPQLAPRHAAYGAPAPQPGPSGAAAGAYSAAPVQPYGQPYGSSGYGVPAAAQQPQQVAVAAPPAVSLMDQVPHQQPAYPAYFQQGAPQVQAAAPPQQQAAPGGWQVHYTAEGRPYYYNAATGVTQWDPPAAAA